MKLSESTDLGLTFAKAVLSHDAELLHSLLDAYPSKVSLFTSDFQRLEPILNLNDKNWFREQIGGSVPKQEESKPPLDSVVTLPLPEPEPKPTDNLISVQNLAKILSVPPRIIWQYLLISHHPYYAFLKNGEIDTRIGGIFFGDIPTLILGLETFKMECEIFNINNRLLSIFKHSTPHQF